MECGNRLRVGVRAKNASVSGFACRPFWVLVPLSPGFLCNLGLRSWWPSKEVPKPRPGKVSKKCFGKCRSETGCRNKKTKKVLRESREREKKNRESRAREQKKRQREREPREGPGLSEGLFRDFSWPRGFEHFFRWETRDCRDLDKTDQTDLRQTRQT